MLTDLTAFPAVDPIPLPAPVWLFKLLHIVTLTLHFIAVHLLLGGLLVVVYLNWNGHRKNQAQALAASSRVGGWLPIIMTYVINLGVPPLLFAQVLYGRALYTSSVLIGAYWIAVIPLLIACYQLLYTMNYRLEVGRQGWGFGLGAVVLALIIAMIYVTNMNLAQHPELWRDLYRASQAGTSFPHSDSVVQARWLYMIAGGLAAVALLLAWMGANPKDDADAQGEYQSQLAGPLSLAGGAGALICGAWIFFGQIGAVREAFTDNFLWVLGALLWTASCVGLAGFGWLAWKQPTGLSRNLRLLWSGIAFVQVATAVLVRDGLRDAALGVSGFDVWAREVHVNWSVLGLFLILFVAGLGVIGWLVAVSLKAGNTVPEGEAS